MFQVTCQWSWRKKTVGMLNCFHGIMLQIDHLKLSEESKAGLVQMTDFQGGKLVNLVFIWLNAIWANMSYIEELEREKNFRNLCFICTSILRVNYCNEREHSNGHWPYRTPWWISYFFTSAFPKSFIRINWCSSYAFFF